MLGPTKWHPSQTDQLVAARFLERARKVRQGNGAAGSRTLGLRRLSIPGRARSALKARQQLCHQHIRRHGNPQFGPRQPKMIERPTVMEAFVRRNDYDASVLALVGSRG